MRTYLTELLDWYGGEIAGEVFFGALGRNAEAPEHTAKWQTLARLERFVADRLRSELTARGVLLPSPDKDVRRGLDWARTYSGLPWPEVLRRLRPELDGYVRDFQNAESGMPEDLLPLAQFVTSHEQALLDFVILELEQGGRHSLDSVLILLGEEVRTESRGAR
jgi:hypothetical protein